LHSHVDHLTRIIHRSISVSRSSFNKSQDEAERFRTLLSQRTSLKINYFLWMLFHIHSDVQQRETTLAELQESIAEHAELVNEKEAILKQAKKQASKARSQSSAKDKLRMKLEGEVDKLQPAVIESTEAISALRKRVATDTKTVAKIKQDKNEHGEKLEELSEEIEEYKQMEAELQREYDELKQSEQGVGSMTEDQEQEYERIRDAAAVASTVPRRKLQSAVRTLESARAKAAKVAEERKELQSRKDEAERSVGVLTARKETLEKVRCYFVMFGNSRRSIQSNIASVTSISPFLAEPREDPI
jgi:chromosome segregation ATPase